MPQILKPTRRNVTIVAWCLFPFFVARLIPKLFRAAADDVLHEIDRYRPFADYEGEGRGPSVRTKPEEPSA